MGNPLEPVFCAEVGCGLGILPVALVLHTAEGLAVLRLPLTDSRAADHTDCMRAGTATLLGVEEQVNSLNSLMVHMSH